MVRVKGLVGMISVRVIHYTYESPYKDRDTRACVCALLQIRLNFKKTLRVAHENEKC